MDSEIQNIELLNVAIKKLIEEAKGDENDQLLLSRLLSQVESLKQEQNNRSEPKPKSNDNGDIDEEEIVKQLNKVKRQNSITHWLLSTMIVLIVAWQASEVSLILKLKGVSDGLTHPFRSLGGLLTNVFKRRLVNDADGDDSTNVAPPLPAPPPLRIPELPHLGLPDLGSNGRRDDQ